MREEEIVAARPPPLDSLTSPYRVPPPTLIAKTPAAYVRLAPRESIGVRVLISWFKLVFATIWRKNPISAYVGGISQYAEIIRHIGKRLPQVRR